MHAERGVTLVEVVVVLVVLALLLALGAGPWAAALARTKAAVTANEFVHAITSARSLAVRNGRGAATICPADGDECDIGADWNNGWFLFADRDRSGTREAGEPITQVWPKPAAPLTVTATSWAIMFTADGSLATPEGVLIMICDTSGKTPPRSVRVWGMGTHSIHSPDTCELP